MTAGRSAFIEASFWFHPHERAEVLLGLAPPASHKQAAGGLLIARDKATTQGRELVMSEIVQIADASDLCIRSSEVKEFRRWPSELQICYCCTYLLLLIFT